MHRRWMTLGLAFELGIVTTWVAGCTSQEKIDMIDRLDGEMKPAREELGKVLAALPAPGSEKEVPCAAPVAQWIRRAEAELTWALGTGELTGVDQSVAFAVRSGEMSIVSHERLEGWKKNSEVPLGQVRGVRSDLESYQRIQHLVVVRTSKSSLGKFDAEKIEEDGEWSGWVFVVDKKSLQIVGAAPGAAKSSSSVTYLRHEDKGVPTYALLEDALRAGLQQATTKLGCVK